MSYYEHHVFFCINQRKGVDACCNNHGAEGLRRYAKDKMNSLAKENSPRIRINSSGCLDRCAEGPVIVIYPQGTWYTYVDKEDIDEIIDEHLINGREVERLKI